MRKYLSTLHTKPDHHKRRFALAASSVVTLSIFGFWALATFPPLGSTDPSLADSKNKANEVSPFESLRMGVASSFEALRGSFGELKAGLKAVNLEEEYQEMRDNALDVYGR